VAAKKVFAFKKVIAVTNVTALTEPCAAAMAPELSTLKCF
jgi:hypothetical protein